MSDEDLIAQYDAVALNTVTGLSFILDELRRRDAARAAAAAHEQAEAAIELARSSRRIAILALVVSVALAAVQLVVAILT